MRIIITPAHLPHIPLGKQLPRYNAGGPRDRFLPIKPEVYFRRVQVQFNTIDMQSLADIRTDDIRIVPRFFQVHINPLARRVRQVKSLPQVGLNLLFIRVQVEEQRMECPDMVPHFNRDVFSPVPRHRLHYLPVIQDV